MKKLYAISCGGHDEYEVVLLFLDQKLRDEVLGKVNSLDADDEEFFSEDDFILIESEDEIVSRQKHYYYANVDHDGNEVRDAEDITTEEFSERGLILVEDMEDEEDRTNTWDRTSEYDKKYHPTYYVTGFSTRSHDHALKTARDRAAQRRAEEGG